jgi:hypothetical protein
MEKTCTKCLNSFPIEHFHLKGNLDRIKKAGQQYRKTHAEEVRTSSRCPLAAAMALTISSPSVEPAIAPSRPRPSATRHDSLVQMPGPLQTPAILRRLLI